MSPHHLTASHGRGGAGNISTPSPPQPNLALSTSTLKIPLYTTGRGGTGNMAINDPANPQLARDRQDVEVGSREVGESNHCGRGGAANTIRTSEDGARLGREALSSGVGGKGERNRSRGLADRGKELLFGGK